MWMFSVRESITSKAEIRWEPRIVWLDHPTLAWSHLAIAESFRQFKMISFAEFCDEGELLVQRSNELARRRSPDDKAVAVWEWRHGKRPVRVQVITGSWIHCEI